ncbi:hypothetical protein e1012e08.tmp0021 [Eimeria tenella]|uniref:Uncharacterized protein n=1 Tax=Eimeria tenella TaxID=5802 RepID=C8TDJ7_EIMTE|nr:hypothetical protein e1012e08.tmp0021 [Eimeria tenella]
MEQTKGHKNFIVTDTFVDRTFTRGVPVQRLPMHLPRHCDASHLQTPFPPFSSVHKHVLYCEAPTRCEMRIQLLTAKCSSEAWFSSPL